MMLVLLAMAAGVALVVGAKDLAGLTKGVVGVVLVVTALPFLIQSCACLAPNSERGGMAFGLGGLSELVGLAALALVGLIAWRRRADRAKMREIWARRHGSPRARSLPSAPTESQPSKVFPEE